MPTEAFFDTNIIVYAASKDAKSARALTLVGAGGVVSAQVLNEFVNASLGKTTAVLSWAEIDTTLGLVKASCSVVPVSLATHERGVAYVKRYKLSLYDSMIVAAAVLAGCTTLYTEDMSHGMVIDGLTITNPFPSGRAPARSGRSRR